MALKILWTLAAWSDLKSIHEYIAKDSKFYAVSFVQQAIETSRSLTYFGKRGRVVPEFEDSDIRELFLMNYRLIYRLSTKTVHIIAIIHGSRDLWSLWKKEKRF